jgi:hypothetical protein
MKTDRPSQASENGFRLYRLSLPAKAVATSILLTLSLGLVGAVGQIVVHDIIPTFYSGSHDSHGRMAPEGPGNGRLPGRGDLFSDLSPAETGEDRAFYEEEQFVWILKWSHIHLFGMNIIFIILCGVTLLLSLDQKIKTWLIVLPFAGVFIDIAAVWLKVFVSPYFFWLHLPGGGMFGLVFLTVFFRAIWEMWFFRPEKTLKQDGI